MKPKKPSTLSEKDRRSTSQLSGLYGMPTMDELEMPIISVKKWVEYLESQKGTSATARDSHTLESPKKHPARTLPRLKKEEKT